MNVFKVKRVYYLYFFARCMKHYDYISIKKTLIADDFGTKFFLLISDSNVQVNIVFGTPKTCYATASMLFLIIVVNPLIGSRSFA